MWSGSHSAASATVEAPHERRRRRRHKLRNLAYVQLNSSNGGILLDIGESGMAARAVTPLESGQSVHLRVDLPDPRLHFEAEGRVAWLDSAGQTGIELLELSRRSGRLLKDWLFTQVLADAERLQGNTAAELLFSPSSRPAIRIQRPLPLRKPLRLLGLPVSAQGFARLVDGLALLCAVLLFSVLSLTLTDALPSWPIAAALLFGVSGIFALLYGCLFSLWFRTTPGKRLSELAGRSPGRGPLRQERETRFR